MAAWALPENFSWGGAAVVTAAECIIGVMCPPDRPWVRLTITQSRAAGIPLANYWRGNVTVSTLMQAAAIGADSSEDWPSHAAEAALLVWTATAFAELQLTKVAALP